MDKSKLAKQLLEETNQFHTTLIEQARAIAKIRDLLDFIVQCIVFAEKYIPPSTLNTWVDSWTAFNLFSDRARPLLNQGAVAPHSIVPHLNTSGSTAATEIFALLTDNYSYFEDTSTRSQYSQLAGTYRGLLSGLEEQNKVHIFLTPLNTVAQVKFNQSLSEIQSLPTTEDPQGPLLAMRSAIDLAIDSLLRLTPLTKRQRGDLRSVDKLPAIAQHLSKDELSKIDLILANERFEQLKAQLSASKNSVISRPQADALMTQAVALLNLVANSVKIPSEISGGQSD